MLILIMCAIYLCNINISCMLALSSALHGDTRITLFLVFDYTTHIPCFIAVAGVDGIDDSLIWD